MPQRGTNLSLLYDVGTLKRQLDAERARNDRLGDTIAGLVETQETLLDTIAGLLDDHTPERANAARKLLRELDEVKG